MEKQGKSFEDKMVQSGCCFLERRGYDVLGSKGNVIFARDEEGAVVLARVSEADKDTPLTRAEAEEAMAGYMAEHPKLCDCSMRYDKLVFRVHGNQALIKHHVNAIAETVDDLDWLDSEQQEYLAGKGDWKEYLRELVYRDMEEG